MAKRATSRKQPAKFDRCVKQVKKRGGAVNAYAVCASSGARNPGKIVKVLGREVREGSKAHQRLIEQKKQFDDVQRSESGKGRKNPAFYLVADGKSSPVSKQYSRSEAQDKADALNAKRRAAGKSDIYSVYEPDSKSRIGYRSNPAAKSAEVFEEFHGYPPEEVVTVSRMVHHHEHVAAAGDLVGLAVKPIDKGKVRRIEGLGECYLAFNEKKNQLFVEGGNQHMSDAELRKFGIRDEHELQTLGKLVGVGYFTNKKHLGSEGGVAVYSHIFRTTNENGTHVTVTIARYPDLIYRVLDEQFEISGGSYEILREGIDK